METFTLGIPVSVSIIVKPSPSMVYQDAKNIPQILSNFLVISNYSASFDVTEIRQEKEKNAEMSNVTRRTSSSMAFVEINYPIYMQDGRLQRKNEIIKQG